MFGRDGGRTWKQNESSERPYSEATCTWFQTVVWAEKCRLMPLVPWNSSFFLLFYQHVTWKLTNLVYGKFPKSGLSSMKNSDGSEVIILLKASLSASVNRRLTQKCLIMWTFSQKRYTQYNFWELFEPPKFKSFLKVIWQLSGYWNSASPPLYWIAELIWKWKQLHFCAIALVGTPFNILRQIWRLTIIKIHESFFL